MMVRDDAQTTMACRCRSPDHFDHDDVKKEQDSIYDYDAKSGADDWWSEE